MGSIVLCILNACKPHECHWLLRSYVNRKIDFKKTNKLTKNKNKNTHTQKKPKRPKNIPLSELLIHMIRNCCFIWFILFIICIKTNVERPRQTNKCRPKWRSVWYSVISRSKLLITLVLLTECCSGKASWELS